jgi:hypothetical protein
MDPFFARNRLSAWLDGTLPPDEAREVADAVDRDPALRAEVAELQRLLDLLHEEGPAAAPPGFHARVMARVDGDARPGGLRLLRRLIARTPVEAVGLLAAAAAVAVAIQWRSPAPPAAAPAPSPSAAAPAPAAGSPSGDTLSEGALIGASQGSAEGTTDPAPQAVADDGGEPEAPAAGPPPGAPPPTGSPGVRVTSAGAEPGAYVPSWEADPPARTALQGMRWSVGDPQALHRLRVVAERAGGRLLQADLSALEPGTLGPEAPIVRVAIVVPADRAPELISQLQGFGARAATFSGAPAAPGPDEAGVLLEVRYEVGG